MDIQVWADFHCPFCYIGKKRLLDTLETLGIGDARVTVRSFLLNPRPREKNGISLLDYVAGQYAGDRNVILGGFAKREAEAREAGLPMDMAKARFGDTRDAHRLFQFAKTLGLGGAFFDLAQRGLFSQGLLLSDRETLLDVAQQAGIDRNGAEEVLNSRRFLAELEADDAEARAMDIDYVPYFVIDGSHHFSGALGREEYLRELRAAQGNPDKN